MFSSIRPLPGGGRIGKFLYGVFSIPEVQTEEQKVAMSVYLENLNAVTKIPYGSVVMFNKVRVNLGDGFNTNTGSFTCPVHGIYFFPLSFVSDEGKPSNLAVYVNDERLCVTVAYTFGEATCSAMTELNVGDVVNVKALDKNADVQLYQSNHVYKNHHSLVGFLYKSL